MMPRFGDLEGKTALVTGSTGGIGQAICTALVQQGVNVFGLALDENPTRRTDTFEPLRCDLTDARQIRDAVAAVGRSSGHLDYLVNTAGLDPKYTLEQGDADRWSRLLDLNLRACYLVIRESLPLLRRGRGKAIVNISSINYRLGLPRRSIYAASKAGILGLTWGLARELGCENIRINCISPGWVFTPRQIEEYFTDPQERRKNLAQVHERQAIKHRISPQDIAGHILFYLSSASAASTGHNCVVDAGWLLE